MSDALMEEYILGTYDHTLDAKGRLILPAAYRARFAEGVHLTAGPENTVQVWDVAGFRSALDQVQALPEGSRMARRRKRAITSGTLDTPDSQGRITIPRKMRDNVGLVRELAVVGRADHFELWDRARWEAYEDETNEVLDDYDDNSGW